MGFRHTMSSKPIKIKLVTNANKQTKLEYMQIELEFTVNSQIRRKDVSFANKSNFGPCAAISLVVLNWLSQWLQFSGEDSNLIGYNGLSNIMADSIRLCSLLIYIY